MLVQNVPLDGGTVGSRPGGDPVDHSVDLDTLFDTPPRAAPVADPTTQPAGQSVPCREAEDADLWFAEEPADLERAKALCAGCPLRDQCLAGAVRREEPWGVWGGEIFQKGRVIARKRPRGRPSKAALARDRALAEAGAPL